MSGTHFVGFSTSWPTTLLLLGLEPLRNGMLVASMSDSGISHPNHRPSKHFEHHRD